jgi:hypothetical protein
MIVNKYIEALFLRLEVVYGAAFNRQWRDEIIPAVKANWVETLGTILQKPEMLDYAFSNLPVDRPPRNAMEFREIALRMPEPTRLALPPPKADKSKVDAAIASMRRPKDASGHPKEWAWKLKEREESGARLTIAQKDLWRAAQMNRTSAND